MILLSYCLLPLIGSYLLPFLRMSLFKGSCWQKANYLWWEVEGTLWGWLLHWLHCHEATVCPFYQSRAVISATESGGRQKPNFGKFLYSGIMIELFCSFSSLSSFFLQDQWAGMSVKQLVKNGKEMKSLNCIFFFMIARSVLKLEPQIVLSRCFLSAFSCFWPWNFIPMLLI